MFNINNELSDQKPCLQQQALDINMSVLNVDSQKKIDEKEVLLQSSHVTNINLYKHFHNLCPRVFLFNE